MSNERINCTKELEWLHRLVKTKQVLVLDKYEVIVDSGWIEGLIAELKRCYERLDKANEAMLTAREVLMKHHEWMSVNDATSEEDDQEILDVVKDLREASE